MNILIIEDRGSVKVYLVEELQDAGHTVLDAYNANDAQSYWNERATRPIHCIILDLNMPPDGLSEEGRRRSELGLLSGWVWLSERVLRDHPDMRRRVIILSDYLEDFRKLVHNDEYAGIRLVAKRGAVSPIEQVIQHLDEIGRAEGAKE
jgi:CheY-like chemotaxis protein